MDEHLPWWVLGVIDWPGYRLFGECWAEECPVPSRRNILHSPAQLRRCEGTDLGIDLDLIQPVPGERADFGVVGAAQTAMKRDRSACSIRCDHDAREPAR